MGDVERAIEQKEQDIERSEHEQLAQAKHNLEAPHVHIHGKTMETYPVDEKIQEALVGVQTFMEQLGNLEVYDVPGAEHKKEHHDKHKKHSERNRIKKHIHISQKWRFFMNPAAQILIRQKGSSRKANNNSGQVQRGDFFF